MNTDGLNINYLSRNSMYNASFADIVREHNLLDADRVMNLRKGEVVKQAIAERSTVRLILELGAEKLPVYIKRHFRMPLPKLLFMMLTGSRPRTAVEEFNNIVFFHRAGIPTVVPIAAGLQRQGLFQTQSFLITRALEGSIRLDHLLRDRTLSFTEKKSIIERLALLVRSMHSRGFNHRDLYLCHLLRDAAGNLFVVDLHRLDRRRQVPERWKVKDIAALNYSSRSPQVTRTDRLRFLKIYLGCDHFSGQQRSFARKVLKKTQKMIQHNRKRER